MDEDRIAVVELADELQVRKQRVFKLLDRFGWRPQYRRDSNRRGQNVATISLSQAATIRHELSHPAETAYGQAADVNSASGATQVDETGLFYLIQLEPEHDEGRFKVGFTVELEGRLQKHRCSAPFARCMRSWPCRRTWERAAIDCATNGCEQLHTEVFRSKSLNEVVDRASAFFAKDRWLNRRPP
jgi:hypothetical protein